MTPGRITRQLRKHEEGADFEYLRERIPEALTRSIDGVRRVAELLHAA
jgi:hypothetical protein